MSNKLSIVRELLTPLAVLTAFAGGANFVKNLKSGGLSDSTYVSLAAKVNHVFGGRDAIRTTIVDTEGLEGDPCSGAYGNYEEGDCRSGMYVRKADGSKGGIWDALDEGAEMRSGAQLQQARTGRDSWNAQRKGDWKLGPLGDLVLLAVGTLVTFRKKIIQSVSGNDSHRGSL